MAGKRASEKAKSARVFGPVRGRRIKIEAKLV
jgi:hypothetical protein